MFYIFIIIANVQAVTFDEIIKKVIEKNNSLKMDEVQVRIEKKNLQYIESENYPTLSLKLENEIGKEDSAYFENFIYKKSSAYLQLNYNLYQFGTTKEKQKIQSKEIDIKRLTYCKNRKNLILNILNIYKEILKSDINLKYLNEYLLTLREKYNANKRLYEAGKIDRVTLAEDALLIAEILKEIEDNKNSFKNALLLLENYSGEKFNSETIFSFITDKENKILDLPKFENTLNGQIYQTKLNQLKNRISLIEKENLPLISFNYKHYIYLNDDDIFFKRRNDSNPNDYSLSFGISYTIFNGFKERMDKEKLRLEILKTRFEKEEKREEYNRKIDSTKNKISSIGNIITQQNRLNQEMTNKKIILRKLREVSLVDKSTITYTLLKEIRAVLSLKLNKIEVDVEKKILSIIKQEDSRCNML